MKFKVTRKDQDVIASVMLYKEKWWLWVISIKNLITYGIPLFILTLIGFSYLVFHEPQNQQDYLAVNQKYEQLIGGDQDKLSEIEDGLNHHTELHGKYDQAIASHLLSVDQVEAARGYAMQSLKRTDGLTPMHAEFAKATLAIAEERWNDALDMAYALDQKLDSSNYHVLNSYNLLRLATLERKLGHEAEEKSALERLKTFLHKHKGDQEIALLIQHFQAGEVALDDYINSRY